MIFEVFMKFILHAIFYSVLCIISIACNSQRENVVSANPLNADEQKVVAVDSPSQPSKSLTEKDLKRRAEVHEKMLKGEYLHDGAIELQHIGDISSIPSLLVVLKKRPPNKNGTMECTVAHALGALRKITNANPGITYESWNQWWINYQEEEKAKSK